MSLSIETGIDHQLKIRRWVNFETGEFVEITVEPHEIPGFIRQVTSQAMSSLEDVARDIATGDCSTCGNTRLVKEEKNGRMMSVACPDCNKGKRVPAPFSEYPRIGGGLTR